MKNGRVLASGAPDAIVQADLLTELYGVPMATMAHPETARPIGFVR